MRRLSKNSKQARPCHEDGHVAGGAETHLSRNGPVRPTMVQRGGLSELLDYSRCGSLQLNQLLPIGLCRRSLGASAGAQSQGSTSGFPSVWYHGGSPRTRRSTR